MHPNTLRAAALPLALAAALAAPSAAFAQVVISQVYGGAGCGTVGCSTYKNDYIELFNRGSAPVSVNGWSVQYASATGTAWQVTNLPNATIPAGGYLLVAQGAGANGINNIPTPDASGSTAMSGTAGKVALVQAATALSGACPVSSSIADLVGYGSTASCNEGGSNAPAPGTTTAVLRAANGCTDSNVNGSDFTAGTPNARNSASAANACSGPSQPTVAVNDASVFEGDSGTTPMFFAFGLSQPAGPGGVSITYTTANGTATAGEDYAAASGTVVIPEGQTSVAFSVLVNGDTTPEPAETFTVRITAVTGALLGDAEGTGTISNDDVTLVPIHSVQGNGVVSPLAGTQVVVEGIVTAQKFNNGFFLQTADAEVDADPATSQGLFVFTSTAPPATATVGNRVRVSGTVAEFTPSTNPNQLSITQIAQVTQIQVMATGQPLPAPLTLTSADFSATAAPDTAEKFEGMRVGVPAATVIAASDGNISESSASATTTGVFHVALPGVARPFREPGLSVLDRFPVPAGKNPPRFDANPERLMVRSRGQVGATALALDVGVQVDGMVGVLDYFGGTWALLPDPGSATPSGAALGTPVGDARPEDVTIGAFNLLRFFDEVNDANGAPTLQAAALDKRLAKTSIAICDSLKAPDILGVVEVENLRVLGLLADRINATCARGPAYAAHLVTGNDVGGINVGFLVSRRAIGPAERVEVLEVTQYGKSTTFSNPDGSTSLLNDRPPLLLRARVHQANGAQYPVTVIVNHLRSLNGVDDTTPGSNGWPTDGARVRAKRQQQALFLANLVQQVQTANPREELVLLGDFNAFEFNDGYVDVMGIVRGNPVPADQVIAEAASPVTRPLIDGSELIADPAKRYSYVFEGNAQTLDHVLVNEPVVMGNTRVTVDHARINADFGVHHFATPGTPLRTSDHDPVRVAISVPDFRTADLTVAAQATPASARAGQVVRVGATVGNIGPNDAESAAVAFAFDALLSPSTAILPAGWNCGVPAQDAGTTTVTCTTANFANGGSAAFALDVAMPARSAPLNIAVAARSQTRDGANGNNQAAATVQPIVDTADLSVAISALGMRGQLASFAVPVANAGPDAAGDARLWVESPAPASYVTVNAPAGWTCVRAAVATYRAECTRAQALAAGTQQTFGVGIVQPRTAPGSVPLAFTVRVASSAVDPQSGNNQASYSR